MQQALDALASGNDDRKVAAMFALETELAKPAPVAAPDGWQLVPKVPTEKMVIDGFESEPDQYFSPELWNQMQDMSGCEQAAFRARLCWAAMLTAAPQPPAPAVDVERGTAVDRFFDTSAVPTAFGDMPRAEAEAIGLWPPAPTVDVEAVRSVCESLRTILHEDHPLLVELVRAIGDET